MQARGWIGGSHWLVQGTYRCRFLAAKRPVLCRARNEAFFSLLVLSLDVTQSFAKSVLLKHAKNAFCRLGRRILLCGVYRCWCRRWTWFSQNGAIGQDRNAKSDYLTKWQAQKICYTLTLMIWQERKKIKSLADEVTICTMSPRRNCQNYIRNSKRGELCTNTQESSTASSVYFVKDSSSSNQRGEKKRKRFWYRHINKQAHAQKLIMTR